jgi:hypothetical protein
LALGAGIIGKVKVTSLLLRLSSALLLAAGLSCASGTFKSPPLVYSGEFHPPPKPGSSIANTKQCECRACDPADCCGAERTENTAAAPAECNSSYNFSEKCGITVNTCTPRCYSQVWRVPNQDSCEASRPLVCCEG